METRIKEEYVSGVEHTVQYQDLTVAKFNDIMAKYGCILIKGICHPDEVAPITKDIADLFHFVKNLNHNRLLNHTAIQHLAIGHPANVLPTLPLLEHVLNKATFIEWLKDYFKHDEFVVCTESTSIRRCDPAEWKNFLPWHQDLLDRSDKFITCWLPLMPINEKTAGLDFVPKKIRYPLQKQVGVDVVSYQGFPDDLVSAQVSPLRWRPQMEVGDIVIFDPYCVHRTSYSPNFCVERYSVDIRINPKGLEPESSWKTDVIHLPARTAKPYIDPNARNFL